MRQFDKSNLLWIGNARDAADYRQLFDLGLQAVLDLALEEAPKTLPRELAYLRVPLIDGAGNSTWSLQTAIELTAGFIQNRKPALLVCSMGMSRSPCIAAAALAYVLGGNPEECLSSLAASGPADIAPALWNDVLDALAMLRRDKSSGLVSG